MPINPNKNIRRADVLAAVVRCTSNGLKNTVPALRNAQSDGILKGPKGLARSGNE